MKTPFQFPDIDDWSHEYPHPLYSCDETEYFNYKKTYALHYLLALRDWVNEGWEEKYDPLKLKLHNSVYYDFAEKYWSVDEWSNQHVGNLFCFHAEKNATIFLSHKSDHTDTIEQLNVLYSITQ